MCQQKNKSNLLISYVIIKIMSNNYKRYHFYILYFTCNRLNASTDTGKQ